MLTEAEKTDTRRFCGYPALAGQPALLGNAALEFRLDRLSPAEEAVLRDYLAGLRALEQAIPAAAANLDTARAAVWTRNADEIHERTALFDAWRRRLAAYLGIAPGQPSPDSGVTIVV